MQMPEILLFTKPGCQKCDYIKEKMPKGLGVQIVDMSSAEGLAEAAYFEILNKNAPILIVDEHRFEGAIPILEKLKMLEQCNGES
jgi:deoxyxylulose-5-phosphate synthase